MKLVVCSNCSGKTLKTEGRYNEAIKNRWNFFCSIRCRYTFRVKGQDLSCTWCKSAIKKTPSQIRQTKNHVFCSKSCSAKYNNRHKKTGTRRSKLEQYLEKQLKSQLPEIRFRCNAKKPVGLELDLYFPDLRLAFEFNGHLHYRPIYGLKKFQRIQELDRQKAEKCKALGIKLHVIDVSQEPHPTLKIKDEHWRNLTNLISLRTRALAQTGSNQ